MVTNISETFDFLAKGGIIMVPIIFCSFLSLAVFIERLSSLKKQRVIPKKLFRAVEELIREGRIEDAIKLCDRDGSSLSRIIKVGIRNHGKTREAVKEAIEEVGSREVARLDKYTGIMGTIASITPLLGLLGTVSGMIKVFAVISTEGVGNPGVLAGGISEALITTASGLSVAIPTFVAYKYILSKADSLVIEMEEHSTHVVELLKAESDD